MSISVGSSDSDFTQQPENTKASKGNGISNESVAKAEQQEDAATLNPTSTESRRSRKAAQTKSPFQVFAEKSAPKSQKDIVKDIATTPINANGDCLVCFYKSGPTEFLGNFAHCPSGVTVWGETFQCSEAAFQWRKFYLAAQQKNRPDLLADPNFAKFKTCTGEEAFQLRKYFDAQYPGVVVSGWSHGKRDDVMWEVLNAKFSQNKDLMDLLKTTGGAYLMEHNQAARDDYWSDNHDGSGKNMLGKMLMAIRDGTPKPKANDSSDAATVQAFAQYANQPGALKYKIY